MSAFTSDLCPETYRMELRHYGSISVVKLIGSINIEVCDEMRSCLLQLVDEQPAPWLILDLSELDFICSVGLGAIITALGNCSSRKGGVPW